MNAKKAADVALKKAISLSVSLIDDLEFIQRHREKCGNVMPYIRRNLATLAQRVHEFNAYTNFIPKP
jgi:hypothetical protein